MPVAGEMSLYYKGTILSRRCERRQHVLTKKHPEIVRRTVAYAGNLERFLEQPLGYSAAVYRYARGTSKLDVQCSRTDGYQYRIQLCEMLMV